jgi:hypothetical protein
MLSKKASVNDGTAPYRKYGHAPMALAATHAPVTEAKASPAPILDMSAPRPQKYSAPDAANPTATDAANALEPSLKAYRTNGTAIHPVIMSEIKPKNFSITRILKG